MQAHDVVFIRPPGYVHSLVFQEVGELLHHSLRSLGIPGALRENAFDPSAINVVLGYHLLDDPTRFECARCIPYQLEPLSARGGWLTPQQPELLRRAFAIWDYSPENIACLESLGFGNARLLPIGSHERLQKIDRGIPPEIDVLFYGSLTPRRRDVIEGLREHCVVRALFGIYGAARDREIARSRIVLNVHQHEGQALEQVRISYLLNNRCFVISEASGADPYEGGIVVADYDRLVPTCLDYLAAPGERERIAGLGFERFRARRMADYLKAVLDIPRARPGGPFEVSNVSGSPTPRGAPASRRRDRPLVTLTMIVKDEESALPACLGSVADLVDEIVVVDTGSSDRTREIAAGFGARVHEIPWPDSFAEARNEGLRLANGRWIFWLDADDSLEETDRRKLRALFEGLGEENAAYLMKYASQFSATSGSSFVVERPQLFRNRPEVRWRNRVHEQVVPSILASGGVFHTTDIVIRHSGYQDQDKRLRKEERNLRLSRLDAAEQPDDACILFHMGKSLLSLGRPEEALPVLERGLACASPGENLARKLYAQAAHGYQRLGRLDRAVALCQEGRQRFPDDLELLYQESYLRQTAGDLAGAEACLRSILEAPPDAFSMVDVDPALRGYRVHFNLALLYRRQGRTAEAEASWRAVIDAEPRCTEAWVGLTELYLAQGRRADLERMSRGLESDPRRSLEASAVRGRILRELGTTSPAPARSPFLDRPKSNVENSPFVFRMTAAADSPDLPGPGGDPSD